MNDLMMDCFNAVAAISFLIYRLKSHSNWCHTGRPIAVDRHLNSIPMHFLNAWSTIKY